MEFNKQTKIAIVGVSKNPEKYGHKIFRDLLNSGYSIVGVNPKAEQILDQKIFASISDIPEKPELLIVVVPPTIGINVLQEAQKIGIQNIWLQPGASSEKLINYAKENNINLIHDACFMVDQKIW